MNEMPPKNKPADDQNGGADQQAAEAKADTKQQTGGDVLAERSGRQTNPAAVKLLRQVCEVFGVNPDADLRPQELVSWCYYAPDRPSQTPAAVHIVTAGGQKLKLYEDDTMDEDTIQQLARIFKLNPRADGRVFTADDLPVDLKLPRVMVTGMSASTEHQYVGGYLQAGGAAESARRQARKKKKTD